MRAILEALAIHRPIFHSEADFQHSLAWELQKNYPESIIRLEYPVTTTDRRMYLDILFMLQGESIAIELKYKTRRLSCAVNNEQFYLLDQSAQDIGRYEVIKDIQRLEAMQSSRPKTRGCLIFLTNDSNYWTLGRAGTIYDNFRLHEGHVLQGSLAWGANAGPGTMKGREHPINLVGIHQLHWYSYSQISEDRFGRFRYILVETTPP